jgi:hypothetical protein
MTPALTRQSLGCGYLPPSDGRVHLLLWQPPSGKRAYAGPDLKTCAGYTTSLPEVLEAAFMRRFWSTGNLETALLGGAATEELLAAILILDNACNEVECWQMTPASEGGGGS